MPAWPTSNDSVIFAELRQDIYDTPHAVEALVDAMILADISTIGNDVVVTGDDVVRKFNYLINLSDEERPDGIVLFPYAGVDYTECMQTAAEAGVAVHVVLSDDPEIIFDEMCRLFAVEDHVFHCNGDLSWPQQNDASILVLYRDVDEQSKALENAVTDGFAAADYDFEAYHCFGAYHNRNNAVKTLEAFLDYGFGQDYPALEAAIVFPYGGIDYSTAVEKANAKGIAICFIESTKPIDVKNSILLLYGLGENSE